MHHFFYLLVLSIIGFNCAFAQVKGDSENSNSTKKEIISEGHWGSQTRSLTDVAPTLYLSGSSINIDSSVALTNLQVTITDLSGNILMNSYITVIGGVEYSYLLDSNIENGTYEIQLTYGTRYLYGYFDME